MRAGLSGVSLYNNLPDIVNQINAIKSQINTALQAWNVNHNGGQTPEEFQTYIADLTNQLRTLNSQYATAYNSAGNNQPSLTPTGAPQSLIPGVPLTSIPMTYVLVGVASLAALYFLSRKK